MAGAPVGEITEAPKSNIAVVATMQTDLFVVRDMDLLHPLAREQFHRLEALLVESKDQGLTPTLFRPFETYRTPQRQNHLLRTTKNTHVGAFMSSHQYGLAVDFVPLEGEKWSWSPDHDWEFLRQTAEKCGLTVPIRWDPGHVEHPRWHWFHDASTFGKPRSAR